MQPNEEARNRQELHKAFVAGAKWWEYYNSGFTMWDDDIRQAEAEAEKRYGKAEGKESGSE